MRQKVIITAPHIISNDGRLLREWRLLVEAGFEVSFLAPRQGPDRINESAVYFEFFHEVIDKFTIFMPKSIARFIKHRVRNFFWQKALLDQKPDIVIASEPEGLIASTIKNKKFKLIYDAHEYYDDETDDVSRNEWAAKIHSKYIYEIDGFVTVSSAIGALYKAKYPNLVKAHVFANVSDFKPYEYKYKLHDELKIDRKEKIVLFHGNLRRGRSIEKLPEIAKNLVEGAKIIVIGGGEFENYIREYQSEKLIFKNFVDYNSLPEWISGANIGLVLYQPENANQENCSPNKVFEYNALGIPVLGLKSKGLEELSQNLGGIQLIDANANAREIAEELNNMLASPKIGKLPIAPQFSFEIQGRKFKEYISRFAQSRN